jgi:DNA-binding IclR family transcriptional regulator
MAEAGDEPMGPNQIAAATGMKSANVRYLLGRMKVDGIVSKAAHGKYTLRPSQPHNAPHNPN